MPTDTSQNHDGKSRGFLPSVDKVLQAAPELIAQWGRPRVLDAVRERLEQLRQDYRSPQDATIPGVLATVETTLNAHEPSALRTVFNLTGTVLHTNLGRALLPQEAIHAVVRAASEPCNLEFDLESGQRGDRDSHIESLLCELTGAEAVTAVNNNAAAVLLTLNTLALDREVPVSRGELIEIGGSFRIPDIMAHAGCRLVEVGTTNRTHRHDYEGAISGDTALLMKVHPSNYAIEGFTHEVTVSELAEIARVHGLPLVLDQGSGTLVDFRNYGLPYEPTAREMLEAGADLVTFSGDKLLGGPQCGIIAGRRELVERIKRNPLKRALRLDKMTIAALAEVLKLYRNPDALAQQLPTLRWLLRDQAEIRQQAEALVQPVNSAVGAQFEVTVQDCYSQIGSGALPVENLPSAAIQITSRADGNTDRSLRTLAESLRRLPRPILGRLKNRALLLDMRCLDEPGAFHDQLKLLKDARPDAAQA